ncbi:uncharacterized protein LOC127241259 [Andrographis paniculata]|uniref:uncharacterized protein LOC127241259 n=1 Tax=Andrographis paniculata TaxID=175694 RepID=UPI0021E965F7|nr:uncharacterized protein LOC127241259 [Andrographis paniculata]
MSMYFHKENGSKFMIIEVYVDDLNIIGTPEELQSAVEYLKREFETKFCLALQIEYVDNGIFIYQMAYTLKVLKSLDPNKDPFRQQEDDEEIFVPEVPYLSAIWTNDLGLLYLNDSRHELLGYADAGYLSGLHKVKLRTGYTFTCGNTVVSWRSTKQTIPPHHQIMPKHWLFMKPTENVYG